MTVSNVGITAYATGAAEDEPAAGGNARQKAGGASDTGDAEEADAGSHAPEAGAEQGKTGASRTNTEQ